MSISDIPQNETVMLLYISRGLLSSLREAKAVLQTIFDGLKQVNNTVVINTCAVINGNVIQVTKQVAVSMRSFYFRVETSYVRNAFFERHC